MPSWEAVRQSAAPQALRLYRPADDPILPWPGIIAGVLVIGVYFWCSSQFIIQRSLAAKNLDHGRWGSLLATVWAPHIARFPTLWQYLQSILSYITPPVVALLLLGIFWRRANGFGATTTMAVGVPLGIASWLAIDVLHWVDFPYLYACGILFAINCLLLAAVCLATPIPDDAKIREHVWHPRLWQEESHELAKKSWYQNYRYLAVGLAAATCAIVAWCW